MTKVNNISRESCIGNNGMKGRARTHRCYSKVPFTVTKIRTREQFWKVVALSLVVSAFKIPYDQYKNMLSADDLDHNRSLHEQGDNRWDSAQHAALGIIKRMLEVVYPACS